MSSMPSSPRDDEFERILHDGITAAKCDQRKLAQSLLRQAIMINGADARPYIWLSTTTDNLDEQRQYLEQAIVVDPGNVAARRSLSILTGMLNRDSLLPEGSGVEPSPQPQTEEAQAAYFLCPQCGGHMAFSAESQQMVCSYCGHAQEVQAAYSGGAGEQALDLVMPTLLGHTWAEDQRRLACERCGAVNLLAAGSQTAQCPYCGSNQLVESAESGELIDPQAVVRMKLDAQAAAQQVKRWLGSGLFAPDDLLSMVRHLQLRPAYYSCWTFDGTLEVKWTCEVKVGSGNSERWMSRNGTEYMFFDDILVPGVKALKPQELTSVEPFNLKEAVDFQPEFVAGWPAIIYDRSLSDASLLAREKVTKRLNTELYSRVEMGQEKRNLRAGGGAWSGMTFKHVLLPVWVGTYHYSGKDFHLLVNGQTGKIGGSKPVDRVKIILAGLSGLLLLLFLLWLLLIWLGSAAA